MRNHVVIWGEDDARQTCVVEARDRAHALTLVPGAPHDAEVIFEGEEPAEAGASFAGIDTAYTEPTPEPKDPTYTQDTPGYRFNEQTQTHERIPEQPNGG